MTRLVEVSKSSELLGTYTPECSNPNTEPEPPVNIPHSRPYSLCSQPYIRIPGPHLHPDLNGDGPRRRLVQPQQLRERVPQTEPPAVEQKHRERQTGPRGPDRRGVGSDGAPTDRGDREDGEEGGHVADRGGCSGEGAVQGGAQEDWEQDDLGKSRGLGFNVDSRPGF